MGTDSDSFSKSTEDSCIFVKKKSLIFQLKNHLKKCLLFNEKKKKNNNNEKIYLNNFCNHGCYLVKLSRIP